MVDFVFDENKIKHALATYCNKVNELYKAGNVESSYNKPIMDLIALFGCKPEDFSGSRSAEAGENVDIKLWHEVNDAQNLTIEQVKYNDGKVYISKVTAICGITEDVWNYYIGGYQIIDKWLKSHKGEVLDYDKFNHLKKIVAIVEETIKIQEEL